MLSAEEHEDMVLSLWSAFRDSNRVSVELAKVFVYVCFHPSLPFSRFKRQIMYKIFQSGQRVAYFLMLHLCNVIFRDIEKMYAFKNEILNMCVHSVFDDCEPENREFDYEQEGNSWTLCARIALLCFLHELDTRQDARNIIGDIVLCLLNLTQSDLFKQQESNVKTLLNRAKCHLWQTLCLLSKFIKPSLVHTVIDLTWKCIMEKTQQQGNVRHFMQLFVISLLHRFPHITKDYLIPSLANVNIKYQIATSLIVIGALFLFDSSPHETPHYFELFEVMLPWVCHYHHASRVCAQIVLFRVLERHQELFGVGKGDTKYAFISHVYRFLSDNKDIKKLRDTQSTILENLDVKNALSLEGMFSYSRNQDADDKHEENAASIIIAEEKLPEELLDSVKRAIKYNMNFYDLHTGEKVDSSKGKEGDDERQPSDREIEDEAKDSGDGGDKEKLDDIGEYQKRINVGNLSKEDISALGFECKRGQILQEIPRQKLVVAASLLQNLPNLAGLTRTSEIFGVGELAIANKKLLKENAFKVISVTSENWVPITEVPRNKLAIFLKEKKEEGYTIVGVEQTSDSNSLTEFRFPEKTVLLVGHENCGLPWQYLGLVDCCVEVGFLSEA